MPASTQTTTTTTPSDAGTASRPRITSTVVLRHGRAGATAIRNNSPSPTGMNIRLKYGAPTATWSLPCTAS
jgi:hypothetical protein